MSSAAASRSPWYPLTLVPPSPWERMIPEKRQAFIRFFWVATLCALVLGFVDPDLWKVAIGVTALQSAILLALVGFQPLVFPVQVRVVYGALLGLGTYVDALWFILPIATAGLFVNLSFDYCLLSRLLHLLPWNRTVALSWNVVFKCLLQPPRPGRFQLEP